MPYNKTRGENMSIKEQLHSKIETMTEADLKWLQGILEQHRRENLKRLARELSDSTEEERAAFMENVQRNSWSNRADT
jgi:hypothetical protein